MLSKENRCGSERDFYNLYQREEKYMEEERYMFCDELEEYKFCPYSQKVKKSNAYKELSKQTFPMYIYLEKNANEYIRIPCGIIEDRKIILIADNNFNQHWEKISEGIARGMQMRANTLEIMRSSINKKADLSLLETETRMAYVGSDYRIAYKGKEQNVEKQRLTSKRANIMDDPKIRFIYSKADKVIHDRTCEAVAGISDQNFAGTDILPENPQLCKKCQRKIYIRNAIKTDAKYFSFYDNFLTSAQVGFKKIEHFLYEQGAVLHIDIQKTNRLYVKYREDNWYIDALENGRYALFHNNYSILDNKERVIRNGFHRQKCNSSQVRISFDCIENYDWRVHLKENIIEEDIVEENVSAELVEEKTVEKRSLWKLMVLWIKKFLQSICH